jgi:hypothetical protein
VAISAAEFYEMTDRQGWDRRLSREIDFGVNWQGPDGQRGWRVTWVEATGEVYATRNGEEIVVLPHPVEFESEIEDRLKGWAILMNTKRNGTVDWVASRLLPELLCDDCGRIDGHNYDVEH